MSGLYIHIPFCRKACTYCDFHFSTADLAPDVYHYVVLQNNVILGEGKLVVIH